ncbi:apolipoprotein D and lipocalin family protein [Paraburkholderia sp. BL27I4N3]|uniref:lipocalin family protein n=1 Tax=Paraburkholderia sp. BL27I4N3 TaxID=1938805 RepID=UPI000E268C35|nr:lipocalin family protein [Paraburkholderia sp. BL27I4N3]REE21808.1 apolipoprotein D and lipocalin family protein [Paraburkholderia sp. BL27I4N3]
MALRRQSVLRASALSLAIGAVCLLGACAFSPAGKSGNAHVPQPAKPVDLNRYLGRWYELARYENGFERDCEAVTADYATREDGLIDVTNSCHKGGVSGALDVSKGRAKVVAGSEDARLKVSFFGPFFVGNYSVLDHADDYSWSIVGEPSGRYLWILTREAIPAASVKDALIERVRALGYDTSMLRMTRHE